MEATEYNQVEAALHFLSAHASDQPSLADLSHHMGLSVDSCHRVFKRWAGITPKHFLQQIALVKARGLLQRRVSLLDASYEVGLSGPSRLHDLFLRHEGMTPGAYKTGGDGVEIKWSLCSTSFGSTLIGGTDRGTCMLEFIDGEISNELIRARFEKRWPKAVIREDPNYGLPVVNELTKRLSGERPKPLSFCISGTPFQVKVWEALLRIPDGYTTTYGDIAQEIGDPKSSRAVGNAVGANPISYFIPCHRVIKATGAIGNYRWGVTRKSLLLAVEGRRKEE